MDVIINTQLDGVPEGGTPIACPGNFYHELLVCLGYSERHLPVADLLRRYDGVEAVGPWFVVSPIHWQATHNDAMIAVTGDALELSESESRLWFSAFAEFIAPEQMTLYYHDAHTWLLQCEGKPSLRADPVHTLLQQSMTPQLRKLDGTLFWQRFITESQMFFSAHPLNKSRPACPINGVWLWGNGTLEPVGSKPLICDDASHELALLLSTDVKLYESRVIPALNVQSRQGLSAKSLSQTRYSHPCRSRKASMPFEGLRKAFSRQPLLARLYSWAGITDESIQSLTKDSLLLLQDLNTIDLQTLRTKLQKHTVRWYWNNVAYTSRPKGWLSRLWR